MVDHRRGYIKSGGGRYIAAATGESIRLFFAGFSSLPSACYVASMKKAGASSVLIAALMLAVGVFAQSQQPKKIPRIGYLSSFNLAGESTRSERVRLALQDRGYIEGKNIATEYRYAEGKIDRFSELAAELVRFKVDIIVVAGGTQFVRSAKNVTKTISIVMTAWGLIL
jgi:ABC-type uncharacterized transport system substrate-binding protein